MYRKTLVAVAAMLTIGSAVLASSHDASARAFGGGGFRGASFHGGGMRMSGGSLHLSRPVFRPTMRLTPKFAPKFAGIKGPIKKWPGKFGKHWPKFPCWKFPHHCHGPHWGGGYIEVAAVPVVAAAAYAAATPVAAAPAPACYECGGWTEDGGFMTYRKVINEQTGQPELKCVKVFE